MIDTRKHAKYDALIYVCHALAPVRTAVVRPCDETSLRDAFEAAEAKIIRPLLIGLEARIRALAATLRLDISALEVVDAPFSHASAARAGRDSALW